MRAWLEQSFGNRIPAEQFAETLVASVAATPGALEQLRGLVGSVEPDVILDAMAQDESAVSSPLLSREGSAWLRSVWKSVRTALE